MRTSMYILIGIIVLLALSQVWVIVRTRGTQQQPFTVQRTIGDLEIRSYPEAITATVVRPGGSYKGLASPGFRTLANYIFGGNAEGRSIAMTAPVHMELGADSGRMRFVMPAGLTMDSLPPPNDAAVRLEKIPQEVVAVLRFGGFASDERIAERSARLLELVRAHGLQPAGPVRSLGYDPPWQLVARRNEVVVRIKWPA